MPDHADPLFDQVSVDVVEYLTRQRPLTVAVADVIDFYTHHNVSAYSGLLATRRRCFGGDGVGRGLLGGLRMPGQHARHGGVNTLRDQRGEDDFGQVAGQIRQVADQRLREGQLAGDHQAGDAQGIHDHQAADHGDDQSLPHRVRGTHPVGGPADEPGADHEPHDEAPRGTEEDAEASPAARQQRKTQSHQRQEQQLRECAAASAQDRPGQHRAKRLRGDRHRRDRNIQRRDEAECRGDTREDGDQGKIAGGLGRLTAHAR
ncbi:hypothetical protein SDC9_133357 [bioreactor metagenome]|uniref:Uncharacterized protein n=1 Tax=bioreactor metagenome TaxID=1076179 RepID=A0A645DB17_9ZZZZ